MSVGEYAGFTGATPGFAPALVISGHFHRDMEILSYVVKGRLSTRAAWALAGSSARGDPAHACRHACHP
jgi:redox-sensitive bicupin YhaK (pirin superfamily)